ncbi:CBS domain-containing protein [Mesorhizobium xinjiangense]|uniref:CBS domain-containing protein n=1 Tax=Mesorhizobium xinjiangense TaxID=2678685 RepID=UPI0012EEACD5|nr:CBS domain-containing protein [Mesorhizobium xinjiangense]
MRAKDLMSTPCVAASAENSIKRAAQIMVDHDLSGLPVLGDDGQLVGIITEGDLLRRCELGNVEKAGEELPPETRAQGYLHSHGWKVGHVMSRSVVAVKEDAPVNRIAELMLRHRIKRVPVLRGDRVVGIVSRRDLLQLICSAPADATAPGDAAMARSIRARLHQDLGLGDEQVKVEVNAAEVHLQGSVRSEAERQAVVALADGMRGVAGLVLDVVIAPTLRGNDLREH